jgi:electron transfer flavoprotein alpha subunit
MILVVMEQQNAQWHRMSWETLAAGQQLSAQMGIPLHAAVLGKSNAGLTAELADKNIGHVWSVEHNLLEHYTADGYTAACQQLIEKTSLDKIMPTVVLFPHTYQVRDFAPKLATRYSQVLISDVISVRLDAGTLVYVRQFFQGKLSGDIRASGAGPHFASIQAGAFRADSLENATSPAPVQVFSPALDPSMIRQRPETPFREAARAVDLTAAEIIVSVGRGIREQSNIPVVEELAKALGAELAASRPICDAGWLPMERQVGSSGQTVAPKMYMAVGISGAIQHLVGMKGAKTIVAINKDANAPIFEVADYGIVGDLFEVVPALVEAVKKAKG